MIALGYILAIVMGLTLGLIGAGGSILTVPILVYLLGVKPVVATGYSLLVVGSAALTGAIRYQRNGLVNIKAAAMFAAPAMLTVLATRTFIVPAIPDPIAGIPKDIFIMMLFAGLMILAATFMLKPVKVEPDRSRVLDTRRFIKLISGSAGVGLLTGMVGAGGGFLIIPTLIALFGLPVKEAIGTSLAIIAINSLVGFQGDVASGISLDWHLLGLFIGLTLLGMWIGTTFAKRMEGEKLKKLFGVFTLLIGIAVLIEELHALFNAS
jgi:uncharacterized membrane protein YfcA